MGAAVAARLVENGAMVVTSLAGRSGESANRAAAAGMRPVGEDDLTTADFILSIVPPGEALSLAERLAPVLRAAPRKPLYLDCNAVSPATVERIAAVFADAVCPFADAGIIGGPPRPGDRGPRVYVSGEEAARAEILGRHGLDIRLLGAPVGAASALKMAYGGLNKGVIALGSAMALAAERAGVAAAFHAELAASQSALLAQLTRGVPDMFPKAYRWVAEMDEVAVFSARDAESKTYRGIAALYQRLAADFEGPHQDINALAAFFAQSGRADL
jgi:3-hydroxyisobutyrate dehydrogenase-like beta-hydroxyacid dehydrogenase